jgi:hypothetical protein
MGTPRQPHLYRVLLLGSHGQRREFTALSWLGSHKAVAMAVEAHYGPTMTRWFGRRAWTIFDVKVEDMGPPQRNPNGSIVGGWKPLLEDRSES